MRPDREDTGGQTHVERAPHVPAAKAAEESGLRKGGGQGTEGLGHERPVLGQRRPTGHHHHVVGRHQPARLGQRLVLGLAPVEERAHEPGGLTGDVAQGGGGVRREGGAPGRELDDGGPAGEGGAPQPQEENGQLLPDVPGEQRRPCRR